MAQEGIGQVEGRMLRMSSRFFNAHSILASERQKVHLGQSGLSTSDIHFWLRKLDSDSLCDLLGDSMNFTAQLGCILGDIALDVAEFELKFDRARRGRGCVHASCL